MVKIGSVDPEIMGWEGGSQKKIKKNISRTSSLKGKAKQFYVEVSWPWHVMAIYLFTNYLPYIGYSTPLMFKGPLWSTTRTSDYYAYSCTSNGGRGPTGARTSGLCRPAASTGHWCSGRCDWTSTCCQCLLLKEALAAPAPPTGSNRHVPEPGPTAGTRSLHAGTLPARRWSVGGQRTPTAEFCRTLTAESGSPNSRTTRSWIWWTTAERSAHSSE